MKKLIYSLALVIAGLTSCTGWDDPVTEKYADGPSIAIAITATTDSAITFTLTPAEGTQFYSFVTDANDEAETLDGYTLLKGQYENAANVKNVASDPTFTYTIAAEPNTVYQIYAVAANDKGIVGEVAVASATTTDALAPALADDAFADDADTKSVAVSFDQDLILSEGAVITGVYYKEWDWENPVTIEAEDIQTEVKGNVVTFSAPTTPDGAYVAFSWGAGAFVDAKGNKCGAFTSTYDITEEGVDFIGAWVHNANSTFALADSMITAPADGSLITNVKDFNGEITLPFNIYRIDEEVKSGDLTVTYTSAKKTVVTKLDADDWSVEGKVLSFKLPATPEAGDVITVQVAEGVIFDVCGNANEAFESTVSWKFFAPKKEDVFGKFDLIYTYTYDGKQYTESLGTVTIEENPSEEVPTGILVKDFYLAGSELEGYYDLSSGKIYIYDGQVLGKYTNSKGTVYGLVFYNYDNKTNDAVDVPFTMNADGTMTQDACWGVYAFDEAFENPLGWLDSADESVLTPSTEPAEEPTTARRSSKKAIVKKTVRIKAPANRNHKKYVIR